MRISRFAVLPLVVVINCAGLVAQQIPTGQVTERVFQIRVGSETGSSFTIERANNQYLITARHIVKSLPQTKATVEVWIGGLWRKLDVAIIYPANADADIAVLKLQADVSRRYDNEVGGVVILGEECYFLGFPYGLYTFAFGGHHPFEKHAYLSAIDILDPSAEVFYLDGFNNPGFSGGPVVSYDHKTSKWMILAVVSGYRPMNAQTRVGKNTVDTNILVNSGIVVTYSIQHALDAIDIDKASEAK